MNPEFNTFLVFFLPTPTVLAVTLFLNFLSQYLFHISGINLVAFIHYIHFLFFSVKVIKCLIKCDLNFYIFVRLLHKNEFTGFKKALVRLSHPYL